MYKQLLKEKKYEEALAYLDTHISSFIDLSYVYDQKGRLYHLLGNDDLAIEFLQQSYLLDEDPVTLDALLEIYLQLEDYQNALSIYQIKEDHENIGLCYMELGLFDQAIESFKVLESRQDIDLNLMICYEMIGEDEIAKEYALKYIENDGEVLLELLNINERLKEYDLLIIEKMKDYSLDHYYQYLGNYYKVNQQYTKAIEVYSKIENLSIETLKSYIYVLVKENKREVAYLKAKQLYEIENTNENLIELIEIGVIYEQSDLLSYLDLYKLKFGLDSFILKKYIRYYYHKDLSEMAKYIALYRSYNKEDEEFLILENKYLEKIGMPIHTNQQKILKLRNAYLTYPALPELSQPLNYQEIERIYEFSEGLAYIEGKDKGGFIDLNGQLVIDFCLEKDSTSRMDTYMFHHGYAIIFENQKYHLIDKKGNRIIEDANEILFTKENYYYQKEDITYQDGKIYPYIAKKAHENRMAFLKDGKWGYLDLEGNIVIDPIYDHADRFKNHHALVSKEGKYGYIDLKGNIIIDLIYEHGHKMQGNQVVVKKGKYGVINTQQQVILDFIYDEMKEDEKYYYVCIQNKWGIYDHHGNCIVDLIYDEILYFWHGLTRVKHNDYYGMIDETGKVIIPIVFDHVTYAKNGITIVGLGGYFAYMNEKGKLLCPICLNTATLKGSEGNYVFSINNKFYIMKGIELWNS